VLGVLALLVPVVFFARVAFTAPGDLVLPRAPGSMNVDSLPASVFPHWVHRVNYRCDACHTRLFEMKLGATEVTMDMMKNGESCGTCHNGDIAFAVALETCDRCHVPQLQSSCHGPCAMVLRIQVAVMCGDHEAQHPSLGLV
jgi:c(7)-type cytochrome triheme protein